MGWNWNGSSMNRRSFLKGLLGVVAVTLCPIPLPKVERWEAKAGYNKGTVSDIHTVGYKGKNSFDAGYVYCPYIPLQIVKAKI